MPPRAGVRLSCAEIRRLFWALVVGVEQRVGAVLRWSWWRRWHQAWARYYHYRCRNNKGEMVVQGSVPKACDERGIDAVWEQIAPLLPTAKPGGRPYGYEPRVVFNAIIYLMQTGCSWSRLPSEFPPWKTVYGYMCRWRAVGILDKIGAALKQTNPPAELQL